MMKLTIFDFGGEKFAEVISDSVEINTVADALDLIGNCGYLGANRILLREENIHPDFFELKTRLAGEVLQKFSNYNMYLAIVGDFSKYNSKSLNDFIFESNKTGRVVFVDHIDTAKYRLLGKKSAVNTTDYL